MYTSINFTEKVRKISMMTNFIEDGPSLEFTSTLLTISLKISKFKYSWTKLNALISLSIPSLGRLSPRNKTFVVYYVHIGKFDIL